MQHPELTCSLLASLAHKYKMDGCYDYDPKVAFKDMFMQYLSAEVAKSGSDAPWERDFAFVPVDTALPLPALLSHVFAYQDASFDSPTWPGSDAEQVTNKLLRTLARQMCQPDFNVTPDVIKGNQPPERELP